MRRRIYSFALILCYNYYVAYLEFEIWGCYLVVMSRSLVIIKL